MKALPVEGKLKRLVAFTHSIAFLQRYRSDLDIRETRRKELAHRWCVDLACPAVRFEDLC